jgi:hypothetical protein
MPDESDSDNSNDNQSISNDAVSILKIPLDLQNMLQELVAKMHVSYPSRNGLNTSEEKTRMLTWIGNNCQQYFGKIGNPPEWVLWISVRNSKICISPLRSTLNGSLHSNSNIYNRYIAFNAYNGEVEIIDNDVNYGKGIQCRFSKYHLTCKTQRNRVNTVCNDRA